MLYLFVYSILLFLYLFVYSTLSVQDLLTRSLKNNKENGNTRFPVRWSVHFVSISTVLNMLNLVDGLQVDRYI
jgi:hypothetical protein